MKYRAEKGPGKKAYIQLYEQLKEDIVAGTLAYGSRLPSKRLLAEETGVSVVTAEHAVGLLCEEGYAEPRERSGVYVIYRNSDFLSQGEPSAPRRQPWTPPPVGDSCLSFDVLAGTVRRVLQERGERLLGRSPGQGCPELRAAIVAYLARSQGMRVSPEQVVVGSGAEHLYSLLAQLFAGHRFALEDPSYEKIRLVYRACGVCCDLLPLGADGIRSEALRATAATVLHITPFHSFPSGVSAPATKRAEYIRWAQERGGYIIEDNYDSELTVSAKNESTVFSLCPQGRVVYCNTFTKTVAPSLRVGYMILQPELLAVFERRLGFYSCTVPLLEQYVLTDLLDSGNFERHINRVRRMRRRALAAR